MCTINLPGKFTRIFLRHLFCYCTSTQQHAPVSRLHADGCVCTEPTDRTPHPPPCLCFSFQRNSSKVLPQHCTSSRDSFGGVGTRRHKPDCRLVISHSNAHQIISLDCPACTGVQRVVEGNINKLIDKNKTKKLQRRQILEKNWHCKIFLFFNKYYNIKKEMPPDSCCVLCTLKLPVSRMWAWHGMDKWRENRWKGIWEKPQVSSLVCCSRVIYMQYN